MLLLLWNNRYIVTGQINNLRWYDPIITAPRILVATTGGFDIICPFFARCNSCYKSLNINCNCIDFYDNKILIGTTSSGLLSIDWDIISNYGVCSAAPVQESVSVVDGITGTDVLYLCTQSDKLGIITDVGFEYLNSLDTFVLVPSSNYSCGFITSGQNLNSRTYVCEDDKLNIYNGNLPNVWSGWPYTLSGFGLNNLTHIWVEEHSCYDIVFLGGEQGTGIIKIPQEVYDYEYRNMTDGLVGSTKVKSMCTEYGADINYGHYFVLTEDKLNYMNMQSDGYPTPSGCYGNDELAQFIEFARPGHK